MQQINTFVPILVAYVIGSVPVGLLIARVWGVPDIRKVGSGNIGATNVWRVAGAKAAVWVYILDISKGVIAVLIARQFGDTLLDSDVLQVVCAIAAVLGNVLSVFLKFKGGKGVNTSLGGVLILLPLETLAAVTVFVIVVAITRYISLGSMLGACCLLVVVLIEKYALDMAIAQVYLYLTIALVAGIIFTHRQNIGRIFNGTENRFSFSSGSANGGNDA